MENATVFKNVCGWSRGFSFCVGIIQSGTLLVTSTFFALFFLAFVTTTALSQVEYMNNYVCIDSLEQFTPVVALPAQDDSTVFVWINGEEDSTTIYAQKVDNASGLPQWEPYDGVPVCTVLGHKRNLVAVYDTMGGVIIGWEDYRHRIGAPLYADSTSTEIFAQRLFLHAGDQDPNWNTGGSESVGIPICEGTNAPARHLRMV